MQNLKKSYQAVFEKMTFEVGKVAKMVNFDKKMAAKWPKTIQSKI